MQAAAIATLSANVHGQVIDPPSRTVRVRLGCTQGEVDQAAHPFGLAVPAGIVSTTGIAGQYSSWGHAS